MLASLLGVAVAVTLVAEPATVPPRAVPTCRPPAIAGCPADRVFPRREPGPPPPTETTIEGPYRPGPVAEPIGTEPPAPSERGQPQPGHRVYRAMRAVDAITVDGRATERTWTLAPPDDRFQERQPEVGAEPPLRTTVRVAYDDSNLYVFIEADSDPGDVIVRTLRRDNFGIYDDDTVSVKIDPSHNGRDAVSLGVNAEGAQIDSLALDDGRQWITEWDAVWFAETVRRDDGYTVEYQIPFAILGIKSAKEAVIGFNVSRDHPRRNATYDWRLFVPPRSPMSASQFGDVVGLRDVKAQRAIEFTPYALARSNFRPDFTVDPRRRPNVATGGDVRLQVGDASYIEGSFLTDFAQVEADEVQVARDRFPLFFPERRPFFINGLDAFNFGRPSEAQLFFSRRVGLVGGQPVPILGGVKAYGRTGPLTYGILQVQTLGAPDDPSRGIAASEPDNYTVGRGRVQLTEGVNVGMMGLGQHRIGVDDQDAGAGGVDVQAITLGGKLQYYGFLAGTFAESPATPAERDPITGQITRPATGARSGVGQSAYSFVEYRGLYVRPEVFWLWSDDEFDPRLGFYRRPGSSRQQASLRFVPRPRVLGLREIEFGPRYGMETTHDYAERLGQSAGGSTALNWRNGARLGYDISHFIDVVQAPFELYTHTVEAQRYTGFRHEVSGSTPGRRAVQADAAYEVIELFGGLAHQPSVGVTARIGKHVAFGGRYTHLVGRLQDPGEDFNFGYSNANLDVAITRNLAFDNLARLDLSPENQRFGLQSRLRWRFLPGSDLFVVYRNNLPFGADDPDLPPREPFHEITLKVTWYLRIFTRR
jgi:hypothetical protein